MTGAEDPRRAKVARNVDRMASQGASADEIEQYIQSEGIKPVAAAPSIPGVAAESTQARPRPKPSTLSPLAALAPVAQGLTLGAADEILGAVEGANNVAERMIPGGSPGGTFKEGYVRGRDKVRAGTKQYGEEHPVASTALTIAGGVAPALLGPGSALVKAGTPLLARMGLGAVEGAAYGGVSGALSADEDRTAGAVQGALIGAPLGAVLPVAGAGVSAARNIVGRRGAAAGRHADALLTRALQRDQVNPRALTAPAGKPAILPDLAGENTLGLARGAQATPSEAKERLATFLHGRQAEQPTRVLGDLESAAGRSNENVHDVAEKLIEQRRQHAKPLYDAARPIIVDDPEVIATITNSPYFREAHALGRKLAKEEGRKLPPLTRETMVGDEKVVEQIPQSVEAIDYTKRGLDAVIERRMKGGSMDRGLARVLKNKLRDMLEKVDNAVPEYQQARQQFAGDSDMMDALESGRNFLKEDYRVTQKQLAAMTDGEREMHKVGALDAVRRVMDETPDGADVVKRIFGNPRKRDQLKVLLGDQSFVQLEEQLGVESRMVRTKDRVTGGSPTARIQPELAELADTPGMQIGEAVLRGNPKTAALRALLNKAKERGAGNVGQVANEVSKRMLMQPGTPQYQAWLRVLERMQQDAVKTSLPRTVARRALIAGVTNRE
jgi:hypothetical protein